MTREEAESELMQIYGMLSEEKKQAIDVLMAQADGEHDGCKDCVYQANPQDAMPCRECKHNYIDKWKAIPSAEPKTGHWIEEDVFDGDIAYRCSECNELFWIESGTPKDNEYNFCPKCGANLVEPREREDEA